MKSLYNGIYRPLARTGALRPVAVAFAVVIAIFIAYGFIERVWLSDYDPRTLYWLHVGRGLIASLAAALIVGWLMYRASGALRTSVLSTREWVDGKLPLENTRHGYYTQWLIQLRWIAVVMSVVLTTFAVTTGRLAPEAVKPISVTIAMLALANIAYTYYARRRTVNSALLPLQAYLDLVFLVAVLHFSGGIENPLWIALVFHVAIAGIVLKRHQCYALAGAAAVIFALMAGGEATGILHHHLLLIIPHRDAPGVFRHPGYSGSYVISVVAILSVTLFLVAYFITTLRDRIRYDERQLEVLAARAMANQQLLEQSLITTNTALAVFDPDLRPSWKNEKWDQWFAGVPFEQIRDALGKSGDKIMEITPNRAAGSPTDTGNSQTVLQLTTGTLRGSNDDSGRIVVMAQDVTEQKQAQEKMVRAEKLAAVGEVAGHVAHEINNPVGVISAKCRLLLSKRRTEFSEKVGSELEKITLLADRIAEIVKGLLSYSRVSSSARQWMDISGPIDEAVSLVSEYAREKKVEIECQLESGLPGIEANFRELQQVFVNLLLNALDAMPEGGRIVIAARAPASDAVAVTVEDTGAGIPADVRQSIFEPFFTTKAEGRGTGLGLAVCDGLVRSHGGRIEIDSTIDVGTRATIHLPLTANREVSR